MTLLFIAFSLSFCFPYRIWYVNIDSLIKKLLKETTTILWQVSISFLIVSCSEKFKKLQVTQFLLFLIIFFKFFSVICQKAKRQPNPLQRIEEESEEKEEKRVFATLKVFGIR